MAETYPGPDAAVFDLDGVITLTARTHAAAWKDLFDSYLRSREQRFGEPFTPFEEFDYQTYVDGKPRYEGVNAFLRSRGIQIPRGNITDPPGAETVCGLGNRKNEFFNAILHKIGVDVDCEAVRFVRELRELGIRVGLASSSQNAVPVLERSGLSGLFEAVVNGVVSARLHLRGKPEPDIFLACLELLTGKIEPWRAMVVEDAIAGVEAGRRGGFGLVLGVDRAGVATALYQHGADWVIREFKEISTQKVLEYFRSRASAPPGQRQNLTA
jgi:HAD superfamily hydrolase (TIGR01509 family)